MVLESLRAVLLPAELRRCWRLLPLEEERFDDRLGLQDQDCFGDAKVLGYNLLTEPEEKRR